jgi:phosphate transport system substrate-binding protein
MTTRALLTTLACTAALATFVAGCGGDSDSSASGDLITADGSSTVGPFTTKAAEDWKASGGSEVTVGISGTGGGFERFCVGETDISNASRQIDEEEAAICEENGIEYVELRVATDALTNVVNLENDWTSCLTVEQLNAIWKPKSTVTNWNQVDPSYPDQPLKLYGAGTDSGTFDYFTDVINGEEGASRTDFSATEDDNVTVQGVSGDKGALGYFGFSYFEENQDKLKALEVDAGSGCVAPSVETAQNDTYTPLSRPLFMYVKLSSLTDNQSVTDFMTYTLENAETIATEAQFVPLNQEQIDEQQQNLEDATA